MLYFTPHLVIAILIVVIFGIWLAKRRNKRNSAYNFYTKFVNQETATELMKINKKEWLFNTLSAPDATVDNYLNQAREFNIKFNSSKDALLWTSIITHYLQPGIFSSLERDTINMNCAAKVISVHFLGMNKPDILRVCLWACLINPNFKNIIKEL